MLLPRCRRLSAAPVSMAIGLFALLTWSCAPKESKERSEAQKPSASSVTTAGASAGMPAASTAAVTATASATAAAEAPMDEGVAASRKSCDEGDLGECFSLGYAYAEGRGVPRDEPRAAELYRKSCEGGVAPSCFNLGRMYSDGRGVPKDEARAKEFYRKGCDGGIKPSCARLDGTTGK